MTIFILRRLHHGSADDGSAGFSVPTNFRCESVSKSVRLRVELVVHWKPEPKLRRHAEVAGQTQRRIRRDSTLAQDNLIDSTRRNAQLLRKAILSQFHWLQEFLHEDLSRMNRLELSLSHRNQPR